MPAHRPFLFLLTCALGAASFAQAPSKAQPSVGLKLQDQGLFTPGGWIYLPAQGEPVALGRPGRAGHILSLPAGSDSEPHPSFRAGCFWAAQTVTVNHEGEAKKHSYLLRRSNTVWSRWERVGEFDRAASVPSYLVPLDKADWYLGLAPARGFCQDGRAAHAALFRLQDGQITLQELVDMPFAGQARIAEARPAVFPPSETELAADPGLKPLTVATAQANPASLAPNLWLPTLLPDYLVLGASKAGVLWVFRLSDGKCERSIDLGGVDGKDLDKLGHLDHFLLGVQPDPEHHLVAVTRSPDALSFAASLHTPPGANEEVRRGNKLRFLEIVQEINEIQWWSIDPATGDKQRLSDPARYPERVAYAAQATWKFLIGPDGRVHANTPDPWAEISKGFAPAARSWPFQDKTPAGRMAPARPEPGPRK